MTDDGGWTWTLNWGEIRDDLVVGSCPMRTADMDEISTGTGVTALLSVQTDECRGAFAIDYDEHLRHARRTGLHLVNAPMRDFDPTDQRVRLPAAVCALLRLLAGGHRVYVHCTAGINRSPLTVLGYFTFVEAMTPDDAMKLIHWGRPQAEPYWESYHGCRADLVETNRHAIQHRAWALSQRNPAAAPDANWSEAERQVIREVFIAEAACPDPRRDRRISPDTGAARDHVTAKYRLSCRPVSDRIVQYQRSPDPNQETTTREPVDDDRHSNGGRRGRTECP